ncbi:MAG: 23S rRNA (guanosine(2251)-2'-O)-methyltransferase RlmB [bacterium]|nr:23S rRNA (guanosine(2251)-2'-O)-methyltransferase RlmB [bacterium]
MEKGVEGRRAAECGGKQFWHEHHARRGHGGNSRERRGKRRISEDAPRFQVNSEVNTAAARELHGQGHDEAPRRFERLELPQPRIGLRHKKHSGAMPEGGDGGLEIVYGRHPVTELLRSGKPVQRLHVLAGAQGIPKDIFTMARERAIPVVHTDRARLDYLTHHANHQGVAAEAGGGTFASLEQVLQRPLELQQTPFFLVLDGVQDPGNFGAILRSAEAAGVQGVFIPGDNSCGLTGTVSKASAGADQHIPVVRVAKLSGVLRQFREQGFVLAGTEVEGSCLYTEIDYCRPVVIIMGAEESGLRPSVRELCTDLVRLPMCGKVQSLNVSAAAAICLYEVVRQRNLRTI